MKRIALAAALLLGSVASAFAACTSPAVMHDFPGTAFNMSLGTNPIDSNCSQSVMAQGMGASGSALVGNPVRAGLSDGTNTQNWLAAIALADGVNGNNTGAMAQWYWNGTTYDRARGDLTNGAWVNVKTSVLPTNAATSANQSSQITQETATAAMLGTTADAVCPTSTGTCTLAALIKFLNAAATSATPSQSPAVPIGGLGICDGANGATNPCTTVATVKAASTPAAATDKALVVAPIPSELHIGEIASNQIKVQVAQTVTAGAYSAGNALGGLMTVANASRLSGAAGTAGTGGILTGLQLNSKTIQSGVQVDVFIFDANPTGSTCTDKTAFVIAAADFDKVVGILTIPSTSANGAGWFGATTTGAVGIPTYFPVTYDLASATSIYACAVVRAAITPAATTDISFKYNMLRN